MNPEMMMWRCCQASLLGFLMVWGVMEMRPSIAYDAQFMAEYDRVYAPIRAQHHANRRERARVQRLSRTVWGRMQLMGEYHQR